MKNKLQIAWGASVLVLLAIVGISATSWSTDENLLPSDFANLDTVQTEDSSIALTEESLEKARNLALTNTQAEQEAETQIIESQDAAQAEEDQNIEEAQRLAAEEAEKIAQEEQAAKDAEAARVAEAQRVAQAEEARIAAAAPQVLGSGTFQTRQVGTSGSVRFVKTGNTQTIEISNLSTSSAPNLEIYLSKAGSITSSGEIGSSIKLTALRSPNGTQTYTVPANIDLLQYKSIAIHCTQYNKLFGSASIR